MRGAFENVPASDIGELGSIEFVLLEFVEAEIVPLERSIEVV